MRELIKDAFEEVMQGDNELFYTDVDKVVDKILSKLKQIESFTLEEGE